MKVLILAVLVSITGILAGPISPRGTAPVIIGDIMMVTEMSNTLRETTTNISVFNVLFEGHKVPEGFEQIIQDVNIAIGVIEQGSQSRSIPKQELPTEPYSPAEADAVVDVLTTFVQVHQALLNVVIGKHGLLSRFFFAEPVREALVALEAVIDHFAFDLIMMIPTRAPDAMVQVDSLGETLKQAIATYS